MLDKLTYAGQPGQPRPGRAASERFAFVHGDICDRAIWSPSVVPGHDDVRELRRRDPTSTGRSRGAAEFVAANVVGVADAAPGVPGRRGPARSCRSRPTRSTAGSRTARGPRTRRCAPNSPYSAAKAGGDLIALAYARTHGLDVRVTRCSQQLRPLPVPGEGHPAVRHEPAGRRSRCRSTATAATSATGCTSTTTAGASSSSLSNGEPGEVYNIGGGTELTNLELTERLLDAAARTGTAVRPRRPTARATTAGKPR